MQDVVRRIQIQASQQGAQQTSAALLKLAGAQDAVAVATITTEKATVSVEGKLNALMRQIDANYAAEKRLAAAEKTLSAARNEGLISTTQYNERLALASTRFKEVAEKSELAAKGLETARDAALGLVRAFGAGIVIGGLAELPGKIMEVNHEAAGLTHTAEVVGIATKALQELDFAAAQVHIAPDDFNKELETFSKNIGLAGEGSSQLAKILKLNHVAITGDTMTDLKNYADLVKNAANEEQRNTLITAAFGKGGQQAGLLFAEGAEGLSKAADEADRLGAVLGDKALKDAADLDAQWTKTSATMAADFKNLAIISAPMLESAIEGVTDSIKMMGFAINQMKSGDVLGGLNTALNPFGSDEKWLETQMKAGTAKMTQGMSGSEVGDFYKDFSSIQKPLSITVPATTKLPPPPDHDADRQAKDIQRVTDALNLQIKTLTETDRQKEIDNQLAAAHVDISSKDGQAIADLTGKLYDQKKALDDANQAAQFFGQTAESAFEGLITGGESFTDVLTDMGKELAQAVLQAELLGQGPLAGLLGTASGTSGQLGGILGGVLAGLRPGTPSIGGGELGGFGSSIMSAKGNVFTSPGLSAYSNQIVHRPTYFQFAKGGVMGEAGPEAILPLTRGGDGRLGVAANSNAPIFNLQIITPPGQTATVTKTRNATGGLDVKAVIKGTMKEAFADGSMDGTMASTYGVKRVGHS
jgi:hypothetical protein